MRSAMTAISLLLLGLSMPATPGRAAQSDEKKDGTLDKAGQIVVQPVRDVGLAEHRIAPILQQAQAAPYAPVAGPRRCAAIKAELADLNAALGPDYDGPAPRKGSKVGRLAEAGGSMVVNSLIPFRGVVREVTGAAQADRRLAAAVDAGLARRGYLRGVAQTRGCATP